MDIIQVEKLNANLVKLKTRVSEGQWGKRIVAELEYANRVSKVMGGQYDDLIDPVVIDLLNTLDQEGIIGEQAVRSAELRLSEMAAAAKSYHLICAAHAHLDMNFLWGWDETVSATLNTFRTMLDLLQEYPDFRFSHSQAAAYHIVETYDPEMLEEIKVRVQEGRWEVTASTWVEADKNMPNGESMTRQFLYAKNYLTHLFGLQLDDLQIDFEPDTFGHALNVPETLHHAGIKYYYYCRGHNNEGHHLYRWMAPSGRSVIAYKEPHWYDSRIEGEMVLTVPEFCQKTGMNTMMKVYGVGDHGGGPTRRDIERILDMKEWPIFPTIRFGKYAEYFALTEQIADQLPIVQNELNFIFTGCYSSEARLKQANRVSENLLYEAEALSSVSALWTSSKYYGKQLEEAWRKTLFNQFHDILPGTGIPETRDHALGAFQEISAMANSKRSAAMRSLAARIDTSRFLVEGEDLKESFSEGAGAGVGVSIKHQFRTGESDRGRGKTRIFNVFNSAPTARKELAEITIWDWDGNIQSIGFEDDEGNPLEFQFVDRGFAEHWGHFFLRVLLPVKVPALGYCTYIMTEKAGDMAALTANDFYLTGQNLPPVELYTFVLENELLKAVLDVRKLTIISLINKENGQQLIDSSRPAGVFRFIEEDTFQGGGNAWLVGRYRKIEELTEGIKIESSELGSKLLRQSITFSVPFRRSKLQVTVSLDQGSSRLDYNVECDWHEYGNEKEFTPQLQFYAPFGYESDSYRFNMAFGTIERPSLDLDVPANSWALGVPSNHEKGRAIMLLSDCKYGFRGADRALSVTLLRGSYGPDAYPNTGVHRIRLSICVVDASKNQQLIEQSSHYHLPLQYISAAASNGDWPTTQSFLQLIEGTIAISAIKMPEDTQAVNRWIIRVYETEGNTSMVKLELCRKVSKAYFVDTLERPVVEGEVFINESQIGFEVMAFGVASLCIEFEQ
ncbi:alpha-mannosidase [Paenibacillus sp. NRS-1760]|uniref:alpha-mannosidase n=1 Tax=Paenibacillus sp. NRS-1760 TaxID=3233902 RepID=UPI003D2C74FA